MKTRKRPLNIQKRSQIIILQKNEKKKNLKNEWRLCGFVKFN